MAPVLMFISAGGNDGDVGNAFRTAIARLRGWAPVLDASPVYRTDPQDDTDQQPFLNMVFSCHWTGHPVALLGVLNHLEYLAGRTRDPGRPKGPRPLDLDMVFSSGPCRSSPVLELPHPRMHLRRFVLEPLLDIMDDCLHPVTGQLLSVHRTSCLDQGVYLRGPLG